MLFILQRCFGSWRCVPPTSHSATSRRFSRPGSKDLGLLSGTLQVPEQYCTTAVFQRTAGRWLAVLNGGAIAFGVYLYVHYMFTLEPRISGMAEVLVFWGFLERLRSLLRNSRQQGPLSHRSPGRGAAPVKYAKRLGDLGRPASKPWIRPSLTAPRWSSVLRRL